MAMVTLDKCHILSLRRRTASTRTPPHTNTLGVLCCDDEIIFYNFFYRTNFLIRDIFCVLVCANHEKKIVLGPPSYKKYGHS